MQLGQGTQAPVSCSPSTSSVEVGSVHWAHSKHASETSCAGGWWLGYHFRIQKKNTLRKFRPEGHCETAVFIHSGSTGSNCQLRSTSRSVGQNVSSRVCCSVLIPSFAAFGANLVASLGVDVDSSVDMLVS